MAILWRVYYADGSSLDNTQCELSALPSWEVQAIVMRNDDFGRIVLERADFYLYHVDDGWVSCDWFGVLDNVVNRIHVIGKVVCGSTTSRERYEAAIKDARNDPDFLKRVGGSSVFER